MSRRVASSLLVCGANGKRVQDGKKEFHHGGRLPRISSSSTAIVPAPALPSTLAKPGGKRKAEKNRFQRSKRRCDDDRLTWRVPNERTVLEMESVRANTAAEYTKYTEILGTWAAENKQVVQEKGMDNLLAQWMEHDFLLGNQSF